MRSLRPMLLLFAFPPTASCGHGDVAHDEHPRSVAARPAIDEPVGDAPTEPAPNEPAARAPEPHPDCIGTPFTEPGPSSDEPMTMTMPATPTRLGAITCMKDREVWRDAAHNVRVCTIATRVRVHGLDLAGTNYTRFHANGRPDQTTLARPHTLRAGDGAEYRCAADLVVLAPDGTLLHCTSVARRGLGDVSCRGGESLALHPNGELAGCVLDERLAALGATFPAGARVGFRADGTLASASLSEPMYVAGYLVDEEIAADERGRLTELVLAETRTLAGIELPPRAKVWLHGDGSPRHLEYVVDEGFRVHGEQWSDTRHVTFDCSGKIVADTTEHYEASPHLRSR